MGENKLFGEKLKVIFSANFDLKRIIRTNYSRDNSVKLIRALIDINICDLDVELWRHLKAEFLGLSLFDYHSIHDLSLDVNQIGFYLRSGNRFLVRKELNPFEKQKKKKKKNKNMLNYKKKTSCYL